ncbi:hypothetical protein HBZC1_00250 [Helicobacter bizzozeronii CIII-1]|uniref:Uncharacterized protein n=1 Tax=Helicobacter bizzozeronii (strain CIII-1) TaxID=1002804 RepID=F8KQK7_HELBC|nr:hypothetical protein HBZC1_00250 [Helicobacter bizzozeronii CIII-1]
MGLCSLKPKKSYNAPKDLCYIFACFILSWCCGFKGFAHQLQNTGGLGGLSQHGFTLDKAVGKTCYETFILAVTF